MVFDFALVNRDVAGDMNETTRHVIYFPKDLVLSDKAPHSISKGLDGQGKAFPSIHCLLMAYPPHLYGFCPGLWGSLATLF
jgi:hypothetical protein